MTTESTEFQKTLTALALQLPASVYDDFSEKANAYIRSITTKWQPIPELETDVNFPPPNKPVLLGWYDFHRGNWEVEVCPFLSGERIGRYSSVSLHGRATYWQPLPPKKDK